MVSASNNFIPRLKRRSWRLIAIILVLISLVNVCLGIKYQNQTYPNTTVARHQLGAMASNKISRALQTMPLLPASIRLVDGSTVRTVPISSLPLKVDYAATQRLSLQQRSWLPIANLFVRHDIPLQLEVDSTTVQADLAAAFKSFDRAPTPAFISRQGNSLAVKADVPGRSIDQAATTRRLISSLGNGDQTVPVAVKSIAADVTAIGLQPTLNKLKSQTKTVITLKAAGKTKRFSQTDIASWYTADGPAMKLDDTPITAAIATLATSWNINLLNIGQATSAVAAAIQNTKNLQYDLTTAGPAAKTLTYCTATRGVEDAATPALRSSLQRTFSDSRGWNLGGLVAFKYSESQCDFTVWLSSADQMNSFGAICDSDWSCTVSPNVIINYDRWRFTTPSWKLQTGGLEDYRAMAVNHETGHWFGFNHSNCSGIGQAAPVMQQQSIDLQGCKFNPWPTSGEQALLKQRLAL